MTTATSASFGATPAAIEFALLPSWLASSSALQLPLHQIESQQQAKGREVQRLLLQAHLQQRGDGDVGPALYLQQQDGGWPTPIAGWAHALSPPSLEPSNSSAWATPAPAHQ